MYIVPNTIIVVTAQLDGFVSTAGSFLDEKYSGNNKRPTLSMCTNQTWSWGGEMVGMEGATFRPSNHPTLPGETNFVPRYKLNYKPAFNPHIHTVAVYYRKFGLPAYETAYGYWSDTELNFDVDKPLNNVFGYDDMIGFIDDFTSLSIQPEPNTRMILTMHDIGKPTPSSSNQPVINFLPSTESVSLTTPGESFLAFNFTSIVGNTTIEIDSSYTSNFLQLQTLEMALNFIENPIQIPVGNAALFSVRDMDRNIPLFYAKLYREGFFTTVATDTFIFIDLDPGSGVFTNLQFVYIGLTQANTTIPRSLHFDNFASTRHTDYTGHVFGKHQRKLKTPQILSYNQIVPEMPSFDNVVPVCRYG